MAALNQGGLQVLEQLSLVACAMLSKMPRWYTRRVAKRGGDAEHLGCVQVDQDFKLGFGLARCTASCPPLSGTAFRIAGFLAFEDGTRPLTGSPPRNSASCVGSSHGCRDYNQQSEKRGRQHHSHHIIFPARSS